jgi:hypothetical protein
VPFIINEKRPELIANPATAKEIGDVVFLIYREMLRVWRKEPRWTTASDIRFDFVQSPDDCLFLISLYSHLYRFGWGQVKNAAAMAYDIFHNFYVVDYEKAKRKQNGDI